MHFETLQAISLNGTPDRENDDRFGARSDLAWVIDGATDMGEPGLLGTQGGAAWLASAASAAFSAGTGAEIRSSCLAMFGQVQQRFETEKTRDIAAAWELPKAAFAAAQIVGDQLQVAWAADSPVALARETGVKWCTGAPDTSKEAADARALGIGQGTAPKITGAVLADRRASRGQSDHKALSPNPEASARATQYAEFSVAPGDHLLLMSDGFSSLVSDYDAYDLDGLVAAVATKGLHGLLSEIREIEEADRSCARFPRFKISDDATAVWLKVSE